MKIEKLELKHLAPYKPYELNYIYNGNIYRFNSSIGDLTIGYDANQDSWHSLYNCKLILRPLRYLDIGVLQGFNFLYAPSTTDDIGLYSYEFMTYCFQNHFDVFGLIESGLAVDINTLNK